MSDEKRSPILPEDVAVSEFDPRPDPRTLIPDPPPVRLLAIADVDVFTPPGNEKWLDTFYLQVLGFEPSGPEPSPPKPKFAATLYRPGMPSTDAAAPERLPGKRPEDRPPPPGPRWYRAENFTLHYDIVGKLLPDHIKTLQIEVNSLDDIAKRLMEREIPYQRVRGLLAGLVHLELTDPAGHLIQILQGGRLPL